MNKSVVQILQTFSLILSALVCFLLVFLILMQAGKGGSMGIFGGGGSNTAFGASTMDVVTKFTWWLAAAFFALAILAAVAFADGGPSATPIPSTIKSGNSGDAPQEKKKEEPQPKLQKK